MASRLFGKRNDEEEDNEGDSEGKIETIQVQFKPGTKGKFEKCEDIEFDHFPTKEEIAEEYGGGIWRVYGRGSNGRIVKQRKYKLTDREITYPIVEYKIKVKKDPGSKKWYTWPDNFLQKPSNDQIHMEIGGGGVVKVYGVDEEDKMVTQESRQVDGEPPEWLLDKEDELHKSVKEKIEERRKQDEEKYLKKIEGEEDEDEDEGSSEVGKTINQLNQTIEGLALKRLNENIRMLTKSVNEVSDGSTGSGGDSFFDTMFKEPQKKKLEILDTVAKETAKNDPDKAKEIVDSIPDAGGALVNLISAGSQALSSFGKAMNVHAKEKEKALGESEESTAKKKEKAEKTKEETKKSKEKTKKKEEKEKEEKKEKEESETRIEKETEPEESEEPELSNFDVNEFDSGFDISLGLKDIVEGEEQ